MYFNYLLKLIYNNQNDNNHVDAKQPTQNIGNVHEKLESENCAFIDKHLDDIRDLKSRFLQDRFEEFQKKLEKKNKNDKQYEKKSC